MRRVLILLAAICFCCLASHAQTPPASGMQIWYRGDSLVCTGGCSGTNAVTQFTDKSSNANNATAGTAGSYVANALNSQPGVLFSGSCTNYTFGSTLPLQSAMSVFVVLKLTSTAAKSTLLSGVAQSLAYWFANSGKEQGADKASLSQLGTGTAANDTSYHQMNMTYDGTTVTFRIDKNSDGSAAPGVAITANDSTLGDNASGGPECFNGTLVEIIAYNRVLSGSEITTVENYLNTRYFFNPSPNTGGQFVSAPLLPQVTPDPTYPSESGYTVVTAANGAALTTDLTGVACNTIIRLTHGATYSTGTTFPLTTNCTCRTGGSSKWNAPGVIIQSDSFIGGSVRGTRIDPSSEYGRLAHLTSTDTTLFSATNNSAGCYWLLGIDGTDTNAAGFMVVSWGDESSKNFAHDLVIDHSYLHGIPLTQMTHCVGLNGNWQAIVDSYIADCHDTGVDTQAVFSRDGQGPFLVQNNFLEGAAENTMWGGAASQAGILMSDITIKGSHYFKPLAWWPGSPLYMGYTPVVKNLIEFKNGQRILVTGNVFDTSWAGGQAEVTIFNPACSGAPASVDFISDVTYTLNIGKNSPQAIVFGGCSDVSTQPDERILFTQNVWQGIDAQLWSSGGSYHDINLNCGAGTGGLFCSHDIWGVHETMVSATSQQSTGYQINSTCPSCSYGIQYRDSIMDTGLFGAFGVGGNAIIAGSVPGANFTNDCIYGNNGAIGNNSSYANDVNVVAASNVFVSTTDFHVAPASACHAIASDGTDPGANINGVNAAIAGDVQTLANLHTVTNVSPSTFTHAGGTSVTITGTGFIVNGGTGESGLKVVIGGAGPAVVVSSNTCGTPGQFTVSTSTDTTHFKYSADACTVVTSSPITLAVNDTVNVYFTLSGGVYTGNVNRSTPGNACTSVSVVSSTSITCVTPAASGAVTTGPVSIFVSQFGIPVQSTVFGNYN
jgi:hypothetical protein